MSNFFSSPPISLLRGKGCIQPVDSRVLMSVIGQDAGGSPFNIISLNEGGAYAAIYADKTTRLPVWAYAKMIKGGVSYEMWLYLAQVGIPIYSVGRGKWTNVSKYDAQTATPDDATIISAVDVSKGSTLRSGNSIYASDAFGVSEVQMTIVDEDEDNKFGSEFTPVINIKAAKGLARTNFSPYDIYQSLSGGSLGLTSGESKGLPLPPPTPVIFPPPASKPAPTSSPNWLAIGGVAALAVATFASLGGHLAESATRREP